MDFKSLEINRIAVHKIFAKSKTVATPYADSCEEICKLGVDGDSTLHERVDSCLNHRSRFFELDWNETGKDSFFEIQKGLCGSQKKNFLKTSQLIADKAAEAHEKVSVPDGLLIVAEGKINSHDAVMVIKAEKSDAFSLSKSNLKLIKDIFLSSDKTLYKVGFFIKTDKLNSGTKAYRCFVYDDSFAPSKNDLALYFYEKFLGLSTEANSKLQTNNLYKSLTLFAKDYIDLGDLPVVLATIDRMFLDDKRVNVTASDFKIVFPSELHKRFDSELAKEFPTAIVKDNSILNGIKTKRIRLNADTMVVLGNPQSEYITGSTQNPEDAVKLRASLDSGTNFNFALVATPLMERTVVVEDDKAKKDKS